MFSKLSLMNVGEFHFKKKLNSGLKNKYISEDRL